MVSMSQAFQNGQTQLVFKGPVVWCGPAAKFLNPKCKFVKGETKKHVINRLHIEVLDHVL